MNKKNSIIYTYIERHPQCWKRIALGIAESYIKLVDTPTFGPVLNPQWKPSDTLTISSPGFCSV